MYFRVELSKTERTSDILRENVFSAIAFSLPLENSLTFAVENWKASPFENRKLSIECMKHKQVHYRNK